MMDQNLKQDMKQDSKIEKQIKAYYHSRAQEYESVYKISERQDNIHFIQNLLREEFVNRQIIEVACGTGYWTQVLAECAHSVFALDQCPSSLEIARSKKYNLDKVQFHRLDALTLQNVPNHFFNGAFAGFWLSHIPKKKMPNFISNFHAKLSPAAKVIFIDNNFLHKKSTPLHRIDVDENSYQIRSLANGEKFEIIKNYPTDEELLEYFEPHGSKIKIDRLEYYWMIEYTNKSCRK